MIILLTQYMIINVKIGTDIRNAMLEVAEEPSETRKSGVSSLLSHVMRITSSRLHSKTEMVLTLLLNSSFFENQSVEGALSNRNQ